MAAGAAALTTAPAATKAIGSGIFPTISFGRAANTRTAAAGAPRATAAEEAVVAVAVKEQPRYIVAVMGEVVIDSWNDNEDSCDGAAAVDDIDDGSWWLVRRGG